MVGTTIDTRRGQILAVTEQAAELLRIVSADADMPEPITVQASDDGSISLMVRDANQVNRWANWLGGYMRSVPRDGRVHHLVHADFASVHVEVFAVERIS